MKISPLLAQFLSANKQLSLAGLGRFILDDSGGIIFQHDPYVKEDAELVKFIAENTGKMKSLVASDLDSNLELARQFLNIGKPYLFEGIGTLSKNKFGTIEFVQGNYLQEKIKKMVAMVVTRHLQRKTHLLTMKKCFLLESQKLRRQKAL